MCDWGLSILCQDTAKLYSPICTCFFFIQVIDEIIEEWRKGDGNERIPLTQYTSRFGLKATIHALFDTVLKGHSTAEFEFWKETEEVRDTVFILTGASALIDAPAYFLKCREYSLF